MSPPASIVRSSKPQLNWCRVVQAIAPPSSTGVMLAVRKGMRTAMNQAKAFFRN